jgi:hypothetical protein
MQARCAEIIREDKLFAEVYRKSGWQGRVFFATNLVEARGRIQMG